MTEAAAAPGNETGRQALTDMRRSLGIRTDEPDAERHPLPGIAQLEALADQMCAAGLPTRVEVQGGHTHTAVTAQLTVYRLVQEALTNTLKHTPTGTHATVRTVGEAADGIQAIRLARELRPDVVLMDVPMPGTDGIEETRQAIRVSPQSRVLILTTFDLDAYAFTGLNAGASGFLLKNTRRGESLTAIRGVAAGDAVVSPRITRRLLENLRPHLPDGGGAGRDERLSRLSAREREVLVKVGCGLSNTEIAATLYLAEATVKSHLGRKSCKSSRAGRSGAGTVLAVLDPGLVPGQLPLGCGPPPGCAARDAARTEPCGSGTAFFAASFPPPASFTVCARRAASRCTLPGRFLGCCPPAAFAASCAGLARLSEGRAEAVPW
ncbi:response regulator [Streptomyces sp. NPDC051315]|uniref:response regulator n=1 Tax=Streptomyces sp. NPDC051315 TaxID=3365650 RepID=UPI0037AD0118